MTDTMAKRRWLVVLLLALVVVVVVIQLFRPSRTNPSELGARTLWNHVAVDPAARAILERACVDCHSYRTRWPGYSEVAPGSWLVAHDVAEGRAELNFSEWAGYPPARQEKLLAKMCAEAKSGDMPPWAYAFAHADARLSSADVATLCAFTLRARAALPPP